MGRPGKGLAHICKQRAEIFRYRRTTSLQCNAHGCEAVSEALSEEQINDATLSVPCQLCWF